MAKKTFTGTVPDSEVGPTRLALRQFNREQRAELASATDRIAELEAELADYEAIISQIEADNQRYVAILTEAANLLKKVIAPLGRAISPEIIDVAKSLDKDLDALSNPKNKAIPRNPIELNVKHSIRNAINPFKKVGGE